MTGFGNNDDSLFNVVDNMTWQRKLEHSCDQTMVALGQVRRLGRGGQTWTCAMDPGSLIDWKAVEWLPWYGVD